MSRPKVPVQSPEQQAAGEQMMREAKVMCGLPDSASSAQLAAAAASPPVGSQLHARCKANAIEAGVRCGVIDPAGRARWEQAAEADLAAVESSLAQVALAMATPERRTAVSASAAPRMVLRGLAASAATPAPSASRPTRTMDAAARVAAASGSRPLSPERLAAMTGNSTGAAFGVANPPSAGLRAAAGQATGAAFGVLPGSGEAA